MPIIFGMVLVRRETVDAFHEIFTGFFEIMNKQSQTIITDQQAAL